MHPPAPHPASATPAPDPHRHIATPRPDWLALHAEPAIDPAQALVDPHHHLWALPNARYLHEELHADLRTGHHVLATVFVDCHTHYRTTGPESLRPVGETEFVAAQPSLDADGATTAVCAGIVGWADLALADGVRPVLEAHIAAGQGRFRGIRARPTWHDDADVHPSREGRAGFLREAAVQRAVRLLGELGLTLDVWVYHTQLDDVAALAAACPDTVLVVNHCGGPLGCGPFSGRRAEVFADWNARLRLLAHHANVRMKLGGLGMPRMGFGLELTERPVESSVLSQTWAPYLETCIAHFGAERCMFESNFPVDKLTCSYPVLWNAFKRFSRAYSARERDALFIRTAASTYRIALPAPHSAPAR